MKAGKSRYAVEKALKRVRDDRIPIRLMGNLVTWEPGGAFHADQWKIEPPTGKPWVAKTLKAGVEGLFEILNREPWESVRGGNGIDRRLSHMGSLPWVCWTHYVAQSGYANTNSYVAVRSERGKYQIGGIRVTFYSINGIGEIRWILEPWQTDEIDQVLQHFGAEVVREVKP